MRVSFQPNTSADYYRSGKQNRIFHHFGRLFIPGTLKNISCCLNELLVNFRQESRGIGLFFRFEVPTDDQLAQFRLFLSKLGELHKTGQHADFLTKPLSSETFYFHGDLMTKPWLILNWEDLCLGLRLGKLFGRFK